MAATPPPPGYEEIHRAELTRMFGKVVGVRVFAAPAVACFLLALAFWDPSPWRRLGLVSGALIIIGVSVLELWRFRRQGMAPRAIELNLGFGVIGQLFGAVATGGIESPVLPLAVILALMLGLIMTERRWYFWALIGLQIAAFWTLAALAVYRWVPDFNPTFFGGGPGAGHGAALLWTAAGALTFTVGVAQGLGRALRGVFDAMLRRALEANEESRRAWSERSQELVALSGEIAHELKNPMASVKGLAALLAQNVGEGKGAERLGVLRREVDRMQGILDEFLNFSRPLVPLALERADLGVLCAEVAALHEGLARERGVRLEVRPGPAPARCDPRKIKQVLINLVQNALEASRGGGLVELECSGAEGRSRARVLDRGAGLDPQILERLFQPGATTKARGSGLGLTIARALARQHGGELTLGNREGGGCVAELSLPVEPSLPRSEEGKA